MRRPSILGAVVAMLAALLTVGLSVPAHAAGHSFHVSFVDGASAPVHVVPSLHAYDAVAHTWATVPVAEGSTGDVTAGNLADGDYLLRAATTGGSMAVPVHVAGADVEAGSLVFAANEPSLRVRVTDPNHSYLPGASLTIYRLSPDGSRYDVWWSATPPWGTTDPMFGTPVSLPAGSYRFSGSFPNYGVSWAGGSDLASATTYVVPDQFVDGKVTVPDIVVNTPVLLRGVVTRQRTGAIVTGATVSIVSADESVDLSDQTDSTGEYLFPQLVPGDYTLTVEDPEGDLPTLTRVVHLVKGTILDVALLERPKVSGTVRSASGTPLRGVSVIALDPSTQEVVDLVHSHADGSYVLDELEPGPYLLGWSDPAGEYLDTYKGASGMVGSLGQASPVTLSPGQVRAADVSLTPDTTPASGVDLTGTVTDPTGAVGDGVVVYAFAADDPTDLVDVTAADRTGRYRLSHLHSGTFKLQFSDDGSDPADLAHLPFVGEWSGHRTAHALASGIGVHVAAATPVTYDIVLQRYGAIAGVVSGTGGSVTDGFAVAYDEDDAVADGTSTDDAGHYRLVVPPGTYKVRFGGSRCAQECDLDFIGEWWDNSTSMSAARPVVIGSGQSVGAVNAVLTAGLELLTAPLVSGTPAVGRTLTASTGTWNLMAQNAYRYTWRRDGLLVQEGVSPSYVIKAADAGYALTVTVQAAHGALQTTAPTVAAGTAKYVTATSLTATSPRSKTVALVATVSGVASPGGTVSFYRGGTLVRSRVPVVGNRAVLTTASPKGAQSWRAVYAGSGRAFASTSAWRPVTVRR